MAHVHSFQYELNHGLIGTCLQEDLYNSNGYYLIEGLGECTTGPQLGNIDDLLAKSGTDMLILARDDDGDMMEGVVKYENKWYHLDIAIEYQYSELVEADDALSQKYGMNC